MPGNSLTLGIGNVTDQRGINRSFTCAGCGFAHAGVPDSDMAAAITDAGRQWQELLSTVADHPGGLDALATMTASNWSAIAHACHVRDAVAVATRRIELAVLADNPPFSPWDPQEEATQAVYVHQHPHAVADDIEASCVTLARTWQRLGAHELQRTGQLGGQSLRVAELGQRALHDARHHFVLAQAVIPAAAP